MIQHTKIHYFLLFICLAINENVSSSQDGWYQVHTLECLLPIPVEMVLKSESTPYFFYSNIPYTANNRRLLNISIRDYNEKTFNNQMFEYTKMQSSESLELISAKYIGDKSQYNRLKGKIITYAITNNIQVVYVSSDIGEDNILYMYNECLNNKIPNRTITDEEFEALKNNAN